MLVLNPLSVIINHRSMLVSELLYVEDTRLFIDILKINDALKARPSNNDKPYTPNTEKRQVRQLATQAMYVDWQEQYKKIKRENPKKSDVWVIPHKIIAAKSRMFSHLMTKEILHEKSKIYRQSDPFNSKTS